MEKKPLIITEESYVKKALTTFVMVSALGGLGALGWLAVDEARNRNMVTEVPLIKVALTPYKITPGDPGGLDVPYQDKMIYNTVSNRSGVGERGRQGVILRPLPEEPVSKEQIRELSPAAQRSALPTPKELFGVDPDLLLKEADALEASVSQYYEEEAVLNAEGIDKKEVKIIAKNEKDSKRVVINVSENDVSEGRLLPDAALGKPKENGVNDSNATAPVDDFAAVMQAVERAAAQKAVVESGKKSASDKDIKNNSLQNKVVETNLVDAAPISNVNNSELTIPTSKASAISVPVQPSPEVWVTSTIDSGRSRKVIHLSSVPMAPKQKQRSFLPSKTEKAKAITNLDNYRKNTALKEISDGSVFIQLGAYKTISGLRNGWKVLQKKHPQQLGKLQRKMDIRTNGGQTVLYRLQAGPLVSKKSAEIVCAQLKKQKQGCFLAQ